MSTLTQDDIKKIADLAKLYFPAEKVGVFTDTQKDILTMIKKMDALDTTTIEPLAHPVSVTQPLREDVVTEINQRDLLQKQAPRVEAGLYIVNKFVESE